MRRDCRKPNSRVGTKQMVMKKIFGIVFLQFVLFALANAQVSFEVFPMEPQSGGNNYFGARVSVNQVYNYDITTTGYLYEEGNPDTNHPFSLTISAGNLSAETAANYYSTGPASNASGHLASIIYLYAGVNVIFETTGNMLKFNSTADVNAVLNQLETDYEAHNTNYENQYPNLTADELDDMDIQTGFDEFKPFRDFENLFTGFSSKRGEIETTEASWLTNNFTGTDPDDVDLTFDDAENTIFNSAYSFMIGNDVYQLTSSGTYLNGALYVKGGNSKIPAQKREQGIYSNAVFFNNAISSTTLPGCKTNKNDKGFPEFENGTRRFKIKVAINSIGFYSSAKGKVVHYKSKNGGWKRVRTEMSVSLGGKIYSNLCNYDFNFSERKPISGAGWAKRKQVRLVRPVWGVIWKTNTGELGAAFDTPSGMQAVLPLTF